MNEEEFQKKLEKLPAWAQRYIGKLKSDITHLQKTLGATTGGDTSIWWTEYAAMGYGDENVAHLPDRAIITFRLGNGKKVDVSVRKGLLRVSVSSWMTIFAEASNVISITSTEKRDFEKED